MRIKRISTSAAVDFLPHRLPIAWRPKAYPRSPASIRAAWPVHAQGQSSNIRFTFSAVMGGASGGAASSVSPPSRTSRAFRSGGDAGRRRAARKRYNSSCCFSGNVSAAARILAERTHASQFTDTARAGQSIFQFPLFGFPSLGWSCSDTDTLHSMGIDEGSIPFTRSVVPLISQKPDPRLTTANRKENRARQAPSRSVPI